MGRDVQGKSAFSLIEVVLALGVISFALVGILGLFPVAMNAAAESQRETHAAFIARAIYSDLAASPRPFVLIGSGIDKASDRRDVALGGGTSTYYVAYDESGAPIGEGSAGAYTSGDQAAVFLAQINVAPDPAIPGLSRVEVEVSTPAAAPLANRTKYPFVSLLAQD